MRERGKSRRMTAERVITKENKEELVRKAKEIVSESFGRNPFKRKLENWDIDELEEFIKAFNGGN